MRLDPPSRDPRMDPKAGDIVRRILVSGESESRTVGRVFMRKSRVCVRFWDTDDGAAPVDFRTLDVWRTEMVGGEVVRAVA